MEAWFVLWPSFGRQRIGIGREAKGALAFLADEARLKAGAVVLTKAEAEAALGMLTWVTGDDVRTSETVTVLSSGLFARLWFTPYFSPDFQSQVIISVGGVEQEFRAQSTGVRLKVTPRVVANEAIQMKVEISQKTFEGFLEYQVGSVKAGGAAGESETTKAGAEVADGLQPIFATEVMGTVDAQMASGQVVVIRADPKTKPASDPLFGINGKGYGRTKGTLLIFVRAERAPAKK